MKLNAFITSAAAIAMIAVTAPANAEKVTTETYVHTQDVPGVEKISLSSFDANQNGALSMEEVGEKMFYAFDLDGNEIIDDNEWETQTVMTIVPMEKETYQYVDVDHDGVAESSTYTYETFYAESGLAMLDAEKDGLSAEEFINVGFYELDDDDNHKITLQEWEEAYLGSRLQHNEPENYQDK